MVIVNGVEYETDAGSLTATVVGYDTSFGSDVVVEASVVEGGQSFTVTTIGDYAFYNNLLTSVVIPDSVTTIGTAAFVANQLTSVVFPDSVTTIGDYVFQANQLTKVIFYGPAPSIGTGAFYNQTPAIYYPQNETGYDQAPWTDWDTHPVPWAWVQVPGTAPLSQAYEQAVIGLAPIGWAGSGLWWSHEHDAVYVPTGVEPVPPVDGPDTPTFHTVATTPDGQYVRATTAPGDYFDGDTPSTMPVEWVSVQRDEGSGWVTITDQHDVFLPFRDPIPRLGDIKYRAVAQTGLPSATTGPEVGLVWLHEHDPVFVNTGPSYTRVGTAIGSTAATTPEIGQSTWLPAGWTKPLASFDGTEGSRVQFTGTIHSAAIEAYGVTTEHEWAELLRERQVVCYRDCQGRKIFGQLYLDFGQDGPVTTVSIQVEETHHVEDVRE